MAEVKQLKLKRGTIKAKLTRFNKFLDTLDRENLNNESINNLQFRLDKCEPLWEEFNELQTQIEELEPAEVEENDRELFENDYFQVIGQMKTILQQYEINCVAGGSVVNSEGKESNDRRNPNSNHGERAKNNAGIKLPPIKLPIFDGQYCNWLEFKDLFVALVDEDESLSPIQKFYYLKGSLSESVKEKIKAIEVSAENYKTVWSILVDRYENKKLIIHNHIKAIFELPTLSKESHVELRNLVDSVSKHLRALKVLGEKTESWDRLIIYILANKFDSVTRRDWESHKNEGDRGSTEYEGHRKVSKNKM